MLGESSVLASSRSEVPLARATVEGTVPESGREEGGMSVFLGRTSKSSMSRWSNEETSSLIKIRSEMDVEFRHSAAKGPLWEEVSRKMAKLGYCRSGKKCREKFENIYKYHKRYWDCRPPAIANHTGVKSRTYRFFDQLKALEANSLATTSSSTYSDKDLQQQQDGRRNEGKDKRKGKKRGWMELFEESMGEMVRKQGELQKNLLDFIERREREQVVREEAWRVQEVARSDREREMLARERSSVTAKDNAVISFLQRITESSPLNKSRDGGRIEDNVAGNDRNAKPSQQTVLQFSASVVSAAEVATAPVAGVMVNLEPERAENGEKFVGSSSRWPKAEIESLIKLRTNLDIKNIENARKGPLWEEISAAMKKIGYNRNPKRCKEKWENINKYFKKVKESNKKRRDNSKTCPYFQLLDDLYKQKVGKNERDDFILSFRSESNYEISLSAATPPLAITPEQQWPPLAPPPPHLATSEQESIRGDTDDDVENGEVQFEVIASKVL